MPMSIHRSPNSASSCAKLGWWGVRCSQSLTGSRSSPSRMAYQIQLETVRLPVAVGSRGLASQHPGRMSYPLSAGEVILSGPLSIMFPVARGGSILMSHNGIRSCSATFQ